jgi:predicted RNA binding protein YcfA (HicA-like mRNA interferase family)
MSPRAPVLSGHQMVSCLSHFGYFTVSQKGSHLKMRHFDGRTVIIPMHRELAPGTLHSILRQSGLTVDAILEWLGV